MSDDRVQRNAADEKQVQEAGNRAKRIRINELNDLRFILQTTQGRRFLWRLLSRCKAFHSVWEPSAKIHYNSGQQDVGHFLMAEIVEANEEAFLQMMKESKQGEMTNA